MTPWSARKSDKETPLEESRQTKDDGGRIRPPSHQPASLPRGRAPDAEPTPGRCAARPQGVALLTRHPESPGALRRAGLAGLRRLLAAELRGMALLEQRHQGAGALDRLAHLLPVGLRAVRVPRRGGDPRLARRQVEQRDRGLDEHVVDGDALHLRLERAHLLFREFGLAHDTISSEYVACVSRTQASNTSAGVAPASISARWRWAPLRSGSRTSAPDQAFSRSSVSAAGNSSTIGASRSSNRPSSPWRMARHMFYSI